MMVCAIIPAFNEELRLPGTLAALQSRREIGPIIVVDDGSADATSDAARANGAAQVITLPKNRGKGAALSEGCKAVPTDADIILFIDADLGASATESVKLIKPLVDGDADMAIGLLPPDPVMAAAGQYGGGSGFVVRAARGGLLKRTGVEFRQPLSGQRAMTRAVFDAVGGKFRNGFGVEVGLTLAVAAKGFRIVEVETAFRHRVTGNSAADLLHRARQYADVTLALRAKVRT
jgi:glycosyltransferase involved in cell wall biosynthesis